MGLRFRDAVLAAFTGLACASPAVVHDSRVAIRQRTGDADSALVVVYDARVCSLTFRDLSGRLHDERERDGKLAPSEMTREMPGPKWQVHNSGHPSRLFTAFAFPPGRYEIVELASTEDWEELDEAHPPPLAHTDCDGHLDRRRVRMPFRIDEGRVTLLALDSGPAGFDDLTALRMAAGDRLVRERVGSWYPSIDRARGARFRELVASQREPRDGYDVYPACDHKTAVVRNTGTPVQWEKVPEPESASGTEYYRPIFGISSVHATGFGGGCVRPAAYHLILSDPSQLSAGTQAIGTWLVENDLAGEVDLVVAGITVLL